MWLAILILGTIGILVFNIGIVVLAWLKHKGNPRLQDVEYYNHARDVLQVISSTLIGLDIILMAIALYH